MKKVMPITLIVIMMTTMVFISSCGGNRNITMEQYEMIKRGMTLSEVEDILGRSADRREPTMTVTNYTWDGKGNSFIWVSFEFDVVRDARQLNLR